MTSSWEKFEELIKTKMRKIYSEAVIEHSMNPSNLGELEDADGFAKLTGPCGDTISIWLQVNGNAIINASFMTDGCGTSIASGSMVTEMAKGKSISEAQRITQHDVLDALGGLPEESQHCALLAANTLKTALKDYMAEVVIAIVCDKNCRTPKGSIGIIEVPREVVSTIISLVRRASLPNLMCSCRYP